MDVLEWEKLDALHVVLQEGYQKFMLFLFKLLFRSKLIDLLQYVWRLWN
jgi:hypothetical protein